MAEEEKKDQEETQEPEAVEETPAPEAAEEEAAEEAAEETPEPEAAEEEPPQAEAAAAPAEEEEVLGPKELRKRERSRASGAAGPPRSPEERAAARAERRSAAAQGRSRYRAGRRRKRGEPGAGTPPASPEPGAKKVRQGTVVSASADKTITVEIAVARRHTTYEKVVRQTSRLHAHDESNQAQEGDTVRVVESRPLSRLKRWRLLEVVERAR